MHSREQSINHNIKIEVDRTEETKMNDPAIEPKDRQQLPDAPQTQRVPVPQSPAVAPIPAPSLSVTAPQIMSGQQLQGGMPPVYDLSTLAKMAQAGKSLPVPLAPSPPKLDPMNLLGAAAAAQQQQHLQDAGILRSLQDQKQQIAKYEDEIRRRMLLPASGPLLQAHLVQNDPGRFLGAMGLMGNNFMGNIGMPSATPLAASLVQVPTLVGQPLMGDGRSLRGGVIEPFPEKLHRLLRETEAAGKSNIISFVANGHAFLIHKPERFFKEIVPQYFNHKRLSSFKRQLNLYGFELISSGPARGAYYHKLFDKSRPELCLKMRRSVTSKASSKIHNPSKDEAKVEDETVEHKSKVEDEDEKVEQTSEANAGSAQPSRE